MHFIKKIFLSQDSPEGTHQKFSRYGRGTFEGPFIRIKKRGKSIRVTGSPEYVGILGEIILRNSQVDFLSSGKIFSRKDRKALLEEEGVKIRKEKKKGSVFIYEIKGLFSSKKLLRIHEKVNDGYIFLDLLPSMDKKRGNLKTKKIFPKPGKVRRNFFTATLDALALPDLKEELWWDSKEKSFKEREISHTYLIEKLIIPEGYKNNFREARTRAKREGKIKRVTKVDGIKEETEVGILV